MVWKNGNTAWYKELFLWKEVSQLHKDLLGGEEYQPNPFKKIFLIVSGLDKVPGKEECQRLQRSIKHHLQGSAFLGWARRELSTRTIVIPGSSLFCHNMKKGRETPVDGATGRSVSVYWSSVRLRALGFGTAVSLKIYVCQKCFLIALL